MWLSYFRPFNCVQKRYRARFLKMLYSKCVYKSYIYMICKHILKITFLNEPDIFFEIYIYKWRNWYIKLEITTTRKSGTHLHVTYGALNGCFDLIRSHQQCTPWSPPLEIEPTTTVCRSRNSTIYMCVHARVCVCVCACKQDLALSNLQWLIYNKTKPNYIIFI